MSPDRRAELAAWLTSAVATVAIVAPMWQPGYLLYRDAVSTPRSYLTDTLLGIGPNPPRAVPQDGLIAVLSPVVDGGVLVMAILTAALLLAGVGYGLLAVRIVGGTGAAMAASMIGLWNPFVAERLLQGHWSLFTAYAAVAWIMLSGAQIREDRDESRRPWAILAMALLAAALTPSGWLIAACAAVVAVLVPLGRRRRWRAMAAVALPIVIGAVPWLTAVIVGSAGITVDGSSVAPFALRPDTQSGRLLTALSLGGIWNADAVPASRESGWALVASALFIAVVAVGWWQLRRESAVRPAAILAGASLLFIVLSSTVIGLDLLSWLTDHIGGAGLLRDTTKFAMLAVPCVALGAGAFARRLTDWVPTGFAVAAVGLLVVAPLPDLAWGVGGRIAPIAYPHEWSEVSARIGDDDGMVALWPGGTVRRFAFTTGPSLDPTARMVRASVAESGELIVDGVIVDPASARAAAIHRALATGGDVRAFGVGWVLASAPVPGFADRRPDYRGPTLTLYRIDKPDDEFRATTPARAVALGGLYTWLGSLLAACVALTITWRRPLPAPRPR